MEMTILTVSSEAALAALAVLNGWLGVAPRMPIGAAKAGTDAGALSGEWAATLSTPSYARRVPRATLLPRLAERKKYGYTK